MRAWTPINIVFQVTQHVSLPDSPMPGRARFNLVAPIRRQAWDNRYYFVTVAKFNKPYARSTHSGGYLTHTVKGVLLVWRNGRLIGSLALYKCNIKSQTFELVDDPGKFPCEICTLERRPRPVRSKKS